MTNGTAHDDWRIRGQENYLQGVTLIWQEWSAPTDTGVRAWRLADGSVREVADPDLLPPRDAVQQVEPPGKWDHDHCDFCWAKFMAADYPPEQREWRSRHPEILTAGYTPAGNNQGPLRVWICRECVEDFRGRFKWTVEGSAPGHQVTIIVTDEFASRLDSLAPCGHVWALRTSATEEAARRIWGEHPPQETDPLTDGLTLFNGEGDPENDLLSILDEVELHHGIAGGHIPPMIAVRVLGTGLTDAVREAFSSLGFARCTPCSDGFVAHWSEPGKG
jgi:hypothetical protein